MSNPKDPIVPTPKKPEDKGVPSVGTKDVPEGNSSFTGGRGNNFCASMLQGDGSKPFVSLKSGDNIYLNTANFAQNLAETFVQVTDIELKDFIGNIEENIDVDRTVTIQGPSYQTVNSDQLEIIGGTHKQNIGGKQQVTVGGNQKTTVTKGVQITTISANLVEKVGTMHSSTVNGISKKTGNSSNDDTHVGGLIKTASAQERKITVGGKLATSLSFEATATLGASAKFIAGKSRTVTIAKKDAFSAAVDITLSSAYHKSDSLMHKDQTTVTDDEKGTIVIGKDTIKLEDFKVVLRKAALTSFF